MKLLHFSDLHLDTPFRWAPPDLARARRQGLRGTLARITKLAGELEVDVLTCAGDLYEHERFTPDTAEFLRATFAELDPLPVLLAPGNHDWYGPASLYRQVRWSPNVHLFTEDHLTPYTLTDGFTVWGAAHRAPANTDGFLEHFSVDRAGVHVGLFHGSARGELHFQGEGKLPHAPFSPEQVRAAGLHHALVGHFHRPADAPDHTYPGNPDPLTFGEDGERAAVLATFDATGELIRARHPVATSLVLDLTVNLDGVTHSGQVLERAVAAVDGRTGVARLTFTGEVSPDVDLQLGDVATFLTGAVPTLDAVVPRLGRIAVAYDFDKIAEEATVAGQFVRDVRAAPDLDEDQRRRVLTTGLRALAGRRDELEVH